MDMFTYFVKNRVDLRLVHKIMHKLGFIWEAGYESSDEIEVTKLPEGIKVIGIQHFVIRVDLNTVRRRFPNLEGNEADYVSWVLRKLENLTLEEVEVLEDERFR